MAVAVHNNLALLHLQQGDDLSAHQHATVVLEVSVLARVFLNPVLGISPQCKLQNKGQATCAWAACLLKYGVGMEGGGGVVPSAWMAAQYTDSGPCTTTPHLSSPHAHTPPTQQATQPSNKTHQKALHRRALASTHLGRFQEAMDDYT